MKEKHARHCFFTKQLSPGDKKYEDLTDKIIFSMSIDLTGLNMTGILKFGCWKLPLHEIRFPWTYKAEDLTDKIMFVMSIGLANRNKASKDPGQVYIARSPAPREERQRRAGSFSIASRPRPQDPGAFVSQAQGPWSPGVPCPGTLEPRCPKPKPLGALVS